MEKFCSEIIRRGVHQVISAAGYDRSSKLSCEVLTDVYKEYLMALGRSAQENANNVGRSLVNLNDILQAFNEYKVNVNELKDWMENDGKALNGYSGVIPNVLKGIIKDGQVESDGRTISAVDTAIDERMNKEDVIINDSDDKKDSIDYLYVRPNYVPEWLPPLPNIELIKKTLAKIKTLKLKSRKEIHESENYDKQIEIKSENADEDVIMKDSTEIISELDERQTNFVRKRFPAFDKFAVAFNSLPFDGTTYPESPAEISSAAPQSQQQQPSSQPSSSSSPQNSLKRVKLFKQDSKSAKKAKIKAHKGKEKEILNIVIPAVKEPKLKISSPSIQKDEKKERKKKQPKTSNGKEIPAEKALQPSSSSVKAPASPIKIKLKLPNPPTTTVEATKAPTPTLPPTPLQQNAYENAYEENYDQEVVHCICEPPNCYLDDGKFMVSCDNCQVWFHGTCTGFGPVSVEVGTWYCERCVAKGIS